MNEVLVTMICGFVWIGNMYLSLVAASKATQARSKHVFAGEPAAHNARTRRASFWRRVWPRVWAGATISSFAGMLANTWAWWWRDGYAGLAVAGALAIFGTWIFTGKLRKAYVAYKTNRPWEFSKR